MKNIFKHHNKNNYHHTTIEFNIAQTDTQNSPNNFAHNTHDANRSTQMRSFHTI